MTGSIFSFGAVNEGFNSLKKRATIDHSNGLNQAMSPMPPKPNDQKTPIEEQDDPVWHLLEKASKKKAGPFFTRNIMRETRLHAKHSPSLFFRVPSLLTSKRIASIACVCVLAVAAFEFWPSGKSIETVDSMTAENQAASTSTLSELLIEESLNVAAEDPSIYTRDEIVAMIGF